MNKILTYGLSFVFVLVALISVGQPVTSYRSSLRKADSLFIAGDYKSAKEAYGKILRDTSRNPQSWSRYGFSSLNLKEYDAAMKAFEKSMANHPPRPVKMNTLTSMARVYSIRKDKVKALTRLDSAVAMGYSNLNLIDTHTDFDNIRGEEKFKTIRQKVYNLINPCMADPKAREFDYWIGEWDVFVTGTKTYAGHSKIDLISGGCALLENWDSNSGSGKSLNFIDPLTHKWKQTWVGSYAGGIQEFVDGEYKDGAMRFVFETPGPQGTKVIGRFIFFNEQPGQVRQFNETSSDGGKTWVTSYDFTYFRK